MGDRMRLMDLGAEVSRSLEQARTSHDAASRVRAKLVAREKPRLRSTGRSLRASTIAGGLAFAAAAGVAVVFVVKRETPASTEPELASNVQSPSPAAPEPARDSASAAEARPLRFVVGEGAGETPGSTGAFIAAPAAAEMPITFSDGSRVRLAPSTRVRVAEVAPTGARVLVESGTVHVSVVHKDDTQWAVEAGPFEVRVTGTKFDLAWDPDASGLVVRLREGAVYVRGCDMLGDEGRRLQPGEELVASCKDRSLRVGPLEERGAPAATPSTTAIPSAPVASTSAVRTAPPADASRTIVGLARRGAHADALAAAEAAGFASTCDTLSGPDLLLLADAARYAGRFDRASEALVATRRRFSGSDAAATAAFELGRIAMDSRRDLVAAGEHFETYLRERPNGSLAREALGRALEARHRAGDASRAERLAVRYLAAYPDGPHAALARKLTASAGGGR